MTRNTAQATTPTPQNGTVPPRLVLNAERRRPASTCRRSVPSWAPAPFTAKVTGRSGPVCAWQAFARPSVACCGSCQHDLLAPTRVGAPRGPRNHDGTIIPEAADTMWGTDLTTTITGEGQVAVFVAVDHYSAECVGIHAARRATRFEALEPIRQGVRRCFGGFAQGIGRGLAMRHDHGSQYMSDAFQQELAFKRGLRV